MESCLRQCTVCSDANYQYYVAIGNTVLQLSILFYNWLHNYQGNHNACQKDVGMTDNAHTQFEVHRINYSFWRYRMLEFQILILEN